LFTASDPFNDTIIQYDFWNMGSGGGHFAVNGVTLGANQDNYVSAAQLTQTTYQSGSGTDTLWVRVSDGKEWSPWSQSFTVTAPIDTGPTVTPASADISVTHNQSLPASSLFTASDPFNDTIIQYDFWNMGSGGGHFAVNGVTLGANRDNYVSAAQLTQTTYQSGSGTDTLWVRASDGTEWGAWSKAFTVTAPADAKPVVSGGNASLAVNTSVPASSLFTVSDADGDRMSVYEFWDSTAGGGHFAISGVAQASGQAIDVVQLTQATFVAASQPAVDQLWVRAFDGLLWSDWHPFAATSHV
jgi:hypothetical protein